MESNPWVYLLLVLKIAELSFFLQTWFGRQVSSVVNQTASVKEFFKGSSREEPERRLGRNSQALHTAGVPALQCLAAHLCQLRKHIVCGSYDLK